MVENEKERCYSQIYDEKQRTLVRSIVSIDEWVLYRQPIHLFGENLSSFVRISSIDKKNKNEGK